LTVNRHPNSTCTYGPPPESNFPTQELRLSTWATCWFNQLINSPKPTATAKWLLI